MIHERFTTRIMSCTAGENFSEERELAERQQSSKREIFWIQDEKSSSGF